MKKLILITLLLVATPVFAADLSQDANCQGFWTMDASVGHETDNCNGGAVLMTEVSGSIALDTTDFRTSTGSRVFLDDDTEYFQADDGTAIDISGASQNISFGFWVKMDEATTDRVLLSKYTSGQTGSVSVSNLSDTNSTLSGQFAFRPADSGTPITVNSETTGSAVASGGNVTVNAPSTISDGDVLAIVFGANNDSTAPGCATGWTEGDKYQTAGYTDRSMIVCYKYVVTGTMEASSWTFTTGTTYDTAWWVGSLTGVDTVTQEDEEMNNNLTEYGFGAANSITTATDNAFILATWIIMNDLDITMPGGDWATRAEDVSNVGGTLTVSVASKTLPSAANKQYLAFYDATYDAIVCEVSGDGATSTVAIPATTTWDDGNWHKFDCVADGTDIRIYHNGVLDPVSGTNPIPHTTGVYDGNKKLYLGGNPDANGDYFSGHLDDVYIMDRAITADEALTMRQEGFDSNGVERPTVILNGSFVAAAEDLDYYGGYKGLKTQGTLTALVGNYADRVTHQCIHDKGAFAGRTFTYDKSLLQPDYNHMYYVGIRGNTDDILCAHPSDRLEYGLIVNGTMATDSDWDMLGSPSTFTHTSSLALPLDTQDSYFVIASENEGIQQGTLLIQGERGGHNTQWFGTYGTTGFIYTVSGTPYLKIEDPNGTLLDTAVGMHKNVWDDWHFQAGTLDSSYVGSTTGTLGVYCKDGPCTFYLSNVRLGEVGYGSNYNPYQGLDDYNSGNEQYSIQGGWRTELIGKRWWIINPFDNVYFNAGINNFNFEDAELNKTVSHKGDTFCDSIKRKYSLADCGDGTLKETPKYKTWGFNSVGSIIGDISVYNGPAGATLDNWSPESPDNAYLPYTIQSRMKRWDFSDVDEFIDMPSGAANNVWPDVYDPDWKAHFTSTGVSGAVSWGCCNGASSGSEFRQIEGSQYDLTPYKSASSLGLDWINPWHKGIDLDEEPAGSGYGYNNFGYWIMTMDPDNSTASGINYTKIYAVNWLRAKYTDGGEQTFVDNITYGGSDYLTDSDSWATVTGTVAGKDASALTNLNNAWGTTYTNWKAVWYEDGVDSISGTVTSADATGVTLTDINASFTSYISSGDVVTNVTDSSTATVVSVDSNTQITTDGLSGGSDNQFGSSDSYSITADVFGSGFDDVGFQAAMDSVSTARQWTFGSTTGTLRDDLDEIQAEYYREHQGPVHKQTMIPMYHGNKINYGSGFGGHKGWHMGVTDRDGTTKLVDVFYTHCGLGYDQNVISSSDQDYGDANPELLDLIGVPLECESGWQEAIRDSDFAFSGVVDKVYKYADTDYAMVSTDLDSGTDGWDCDAAQYASIGSYCSATTGTFRIPNYELRDVYWDCSDPTDTGTCTNSGDLWHMFIADVDQPYVDSIFRNKMYLREDSGSIGTLANNDVVTTGTLMFTMNTTPNRVEMIIDNDQDFDTEFNNPHAWDNYLNNVLINDDDDTPDSVQYMMIMQGYVTEKSISCYKSVTEDVAYAACNEYSSPGAWNYSCTWNCQLHINAGDRYHNNYFPVTSSSYSLSSHYELETQFDRSRMFKHTGENFINGRYISSNTGINHITGYNMWEPISDRGFAKRGTSDHNGEGGSEGMRGWGWSDIMANAYDGVEATIYGADGILGTDDDAKFNHGDFVTKAGAFQRNIYRNTLMDRNKGNNATFNGVRFR